MAASHSDRYQLSQSQPFQNRVQASLLSAFVAITNEGWTIPFHRERTGYIVNAMSTSTTLATAVTLFSDMVATDPTVISDATQAGTVALTPANRDAQGALVTDAHIDSAISSQFNAIVRVPGF